MPKKKRPVQLELHMPTHGGAREGAGRPREGGRDRVPHEQRPQLRERTALHVTLRLHDGLPSLRQPSAWRVIVGVLRAVRAAAGFCVVQFSVQTNHLHFIVEADDAAALEHAMRSLCTRLAKRLHACFGRTGALLDDRHHAHVLSSPRETRAALAYVLLNARKHAAECGRAFAPQWVDPYSSAPAFDGWAESPRMMHEDVDCGTSPATTWLLTTGWRRHGPIAIDEVPGGRRSLRSATPSQHPWPVIIDAWGIERARDAA